MVTETRAASRIIDGITYVLALAMVTLYMLDAVTIVASKTVMLVLFLEFSLVLALLGILKSTRGIRSAILTLLIVLSVAATIYILSDWENMMVRRWSNTPLDLVAGVVMLIGVFYAGMVKSSIMAVLALLVSLYPFVGQRLPEPFTTIAYSLDKTICNLSVGLEGGIFGNPLQVAMDYAFLFAVFGGLLGSTGVRSFFLEVGRLLVGRFRSGAALITTVTTALFGTVCGSAIANAAIVGPYTIPHMKEAGYEPDTAAAILSAGSNGGQILPPVMGVLAFAMAGYTGIPYVRICQMAVISALIYYMVIGLYGHLYACKYDIKGFAPAPADKRILLYKAPCFLVPLTVIIVLLIKGYSISFVGFWAILSGLVTSMLGPRDLRPKLRELLDGFARGGVSGAEIGIMSAVVGPLVTTFSASGLGVKLSAGIEAWSHGSLLIALIILWATIILLGAVGVSVSAYFAIAPLAVPVLQRLGVPFDVSHFFIVWPSSFASITPPVAQTCLVSANIAKSDYIRTGIETCKAASPAFILPFLFVYSPALLWKSPASTLSFWVDNLGCALAFAALTCAFVGYLRSELNLILRVILGCGAALTIVYLPLRSTYMLITGLTCIVAVAALQHLKSRGQVNT